MRWPDPDGEVTPDTVIDSHHHGEARHPRVVSLSIPVRLSPVADPQEPDRALLGTISGKEQKLPLVLPADPLDTPKRCGRQTVQDPEHPPGNGGVKGPQ